MEEDDEKECIKQMFEIGKKKIDVLGSSQAKKALKKKLENQADCSRLLCTSLK